MHTGHYVSSAKTDSWSARTLKRTFASAGVEINGNHSHDPQIHNPKFYRRVLNLGSLGLGESYMDGWWDCARLDVLFTHLLRARVHRNLKGLSRIKFRTLTLWNMLVNLQTKARAFQVGEAHYDIGNDLYKAMLDPTMSYSCGYWRQSQDLNSAQEAKLDLICRKLKLEPGMSLLDIGCGWGGLAAFAAKHYGARVTGITVSREQADFVENHFSNLPVKVELMDYRDLSGEYDRVVSVGMFEHVGYKNYPEFFSTVKRVLSPSGLFLLHTIGEEYSGRTSDPFISKYIFPNGKVPPRKFLSAASLEHFRLEDWHNFGPDYDRTLMAWAANFEQAWPQLSEKYTERFYRMWRYYLYCCAGYFRSRQGQLWQLVFAHPDRHEEYLSVR
jgi:cyclopropane-fatty-acyl-phospholipid synthase